MEQITKKLKTEHSDTFDGKASKASLPTNDGSNLIGCKFFNKKNEGMSVLHNKENTLTQD